MRFYATIVLATVLATGATSLSFDGVDDPEAGGLVDTLNVLAEDLWVVEGFVGTTVIDGTQYTTILLSQPTPDTIVALGRTWR